MMGKQFRAGTFKLMVTFCSQEIAFDLHMDLDEPHGGSLLEKDTLGLSRG